MGLLDYSWLILRQQVFIKDVGSMHGTFINSSILLKNESTPLEDGDLLKFGIPIERGADTHPPCEIKAHVSYGATPRYVFYFTMRRIDVADC